MSTLKKPVASAPATDRAVLVVPRVWLTVLTVLVVAPWLIAGALYLWPRGATAPSGVSQEVVPAERAASLRWGTLEVTPLVISPPIELIANDWGRVPDAGKRWFLPGTTPEVAAGFLAAVGLSADQVAALMATARFDPATGALALTPDLGMLRTLTPEVRARLYVQLGKSRLNGDHVNAFRYEAESFEQWFGPSRVSPATKQLVEPLIYRHGQHLFFADVEVVRSLVADQEELTRLAKALLRQPTLRVRLLLADPPGIDALAEYWGRGGRRTDIRPLLESLGDQGGERSVDVVHLLPSFAREHLYRYPRLTAKELDRPVLANCLWTALSFFADTADDGYLELDAAVARLQQDYYLVENALELGDIVAMVDQAGNLFHAMVYLADDLYFTKNGMSPLAPWVILRLDTVLDFYRLREEKPRLIYHRRKGL